MNINKSKTLYICPYCKTNLYAVYGRKADDYFCECHPLKDYRREGERVFSWRLNINGNWDNIPKGSKIWSMNTKKIPKFKQVFTFR
jgi:hypothetical protein